MKKYIGEIRTDKEGSACEFEFEVEDNATQNEIEAEAREVAFEYVEWWYKEVSDNAE